MTFAQVTAQIPGILECYVLVDQIGVFLGTVYQIMCNQQLGITLMVVTQTRVPMHLRINSWRTQRSLTWLFAQVVPRLTLGIHPQQLLQTSGTVDDSVSQKLGVPEETTWYVPIPGKDMVKEPINAWEVNF